MKEQEMNLSFLSMMPFAPLKCVFTLYIDYDKDPGNKVVGVTMINVLINVLIGLLSGLIIKDVVIKYRKSIRQFADTDRCHDDLYFYQRERDGDRPPVSVSLQALLSTENQCCST